MSVDGGVAGAVGVVVVGVVVVGVVVVGVVVVGVVVVGVVVVGVAVVGVAVVGVVVVGVVVDRVGAGAACVEAGVARVGDVTVGGRADPEPDVLSRGRACPLAAGVAAPPTVAALLTVAPRGLSPPVQFACTGVSVYFHDPDGTLLSVHVVVVTIPLHPAPTVAGLPVTAS
jgi:hypothetical protein